MNAKRSIAPLVFAAALTLALLTGCSTLRLKLGTRDNLAKLPVVSMQVRQYHPGIGPGRKSSLIATFTQPDGTVLVTEGKGRGRIQWRDIDVSPTLVTVNKSGVLHLSDDPRISQGQTGHVTLTVPSHPGLTASLDIPLRYNYAFSTRYSGSDGSDGSNGSNGNSGTDGSPGSFDPKHPSAGGNGTNGTNGGDGGNGSDGSDGPSVQVEVALQPPADPAAPPLLQIGVRATGAKEQRLYLVDPQAGGSLTVITSGGSGGKAGKGGSGGRGGSGGVGIPTGSSGSSGSSGNDGHSGNDGRGGRITVTYDPQTAPYIAALKLSNAGGPKPTLTQAPVPPLW